MDWRDISALYVQIELMLIASLKRNLTKHEDWEQDKGFAWPAWQAVKLREMEQYRRQNRQLMQPYQKVIHDETAKEIKRQLAEGYGSSGDPQFFRGNRRYLDSLTHDMLHIEQKAERAALRMMDDVYRQTLSKVQLAMAAGASSLQQAVDMATRDFLAQGINCIVYKNGSRHNIADYVQMALRTTAIRAYLQGEAIKRAELGIDTVVVSQYGACSETCLPWQGRVYIDDVWGDFRGERRGNEGLSINGRWYPLLSVAIRGGLFHPNCRHTLSTWQEGISTLPEPLDPEKIRETATLEQRQRALELRVRKLKRLAEGTLDPVQQAAYKKQVRAAQAELRAFVGEHDDVLRRSYWREKTYGVPVEKSGGSGILSTEEAAAVNRYVGSQSYGLNQKLREGMPLDENQNHWVQHLDAALSKLPVYDGGVFRSLVFGDLDELRKFAKLHTLGSEVVYPAYTSASVYSAYHDRPTVVQKIRSLYGRELGEYNEREDEILFARNSKFRITDVRIEDGVIVMDLEECENADV